MSAFAVAAAGWNGAGRTRCVRAEDQGGREEKCSEKNEPEERATKAGLEREGRDHGGSVRVVYRKTTGANGLEEVVTWVLGRGGNRTGVREQKKQW